jgi:hypothetical protein
MSFCNAEALRGGNCCSEYDEYQIRYKWMQSRNQIVSYYQGVFYIFKYVVSLIHDFQDKLISGLNREANTLKKRPLFKNSGFFRRNFYIYEPEYSCHRSVEIFRQKYTNRNLLLNMIKTRSELFTLMNEARRGFYCIACSREGILNFSYYESWFFSFFLDNWIYYTMSFC